MRGPVEAAVRTLRRITVAVVGVTIVLVGLAMLVFPGPAVIVLPMGLGILALEFEWARRALRRARAMIESEKPDHAQEPPEGVS